MRGAGKLQALVYDILPTTLEEGAGKPMLGVWGAVGGDRERGERERENVCVGEGLGEGEVTERGRKREGDLDLFLTQSCLLLFLLLLSGEATINVTDFQWSTFLTRHIH